jgi:hypothetical protein
MVNQQNPHQNTSTTMWTQPRTPEQQRYYSKHSPKRKVYGWIMTLLQTAHGFLAFAAWTAVYIWVFKAAPQFMWIAPILSISTLFALHVLFRTTWETFWYDRLDDDPETDSSVFMPVAILILLLFAEINGATMYLSNQVKPIERVDASPIEGQHATTIASMERSYGNDKAEILSLYKEKERSATASIDRQIRAANARGEKTGALQSRRAQLLSPIQAAKMQALEAAYQRFSQSKTSEVARRESAVTQVDNQNATEVARYTGELGNVGTYAWVLSVALLSLIAGLGYARVRINVKSGILPLRNYTVLDAHGSIIERFATAFGDVINRRSLQLAVWVHKLLSPSNVLTSFDGTVVSKPGSYNTPKGFFNNTQLHDFPQAADSDALLRSKVFEKLFAESKNGGVQISEQLLNDELDKARSQNGTYKFQPLGKLEPSTAPASGEGQPHPIAVHTPSFDEQLQYWASRVMTQVAAYDAAIMSGNVAQAKEHESFINNPTGTIRKEALRLGIEYGIIENEPEIMVWLKSNPSQKVQISQLTEQALNGTISETDSQPATGEEEELFKQSINLFKQSIEPQLDALGNVIGVKYKKRGGDWVVYALPQVEAFARTYTERASKKPSPATKMGLAKWQYALGLFNAPQKKSEILEAIHL